MPVLRHCCLRSLTASSDSSIPRDTQRSISATCVRKRRPSCAAANHAAGSRGAGRAGGGAEGRRRRGAALVTGMGWRERSAEKADRGKCAASRVAKLHLCVLRSELVGEENAGARNLFSRSTQCCLSDQLKGEDTKRCTKTRRIRDYGKGSYVLIMISLDRF